MRIKWTGETPIWFRFNNPRIDLYVENNEPIDVPENVAEVLLRNERWKKEEEKEEGELNG